MQALAKSGGVGTGSVVIESVTPVVSGGGRRMLAMTHDADADRDEVEDRRAERD